MTIQETIAQDATQALRDGDTKLRGVLTVLQSEMKNAAIKNGVSALTDDMAVAVLQKEISKRESAADEVRNAPTSDKDTARREEFIQTQSDEIELITNYIAAQLAEIASRTLSSEQLDVLVDAVVTDLKVTSKKEMRSVMAEVQKRLGDAGLVADNKSVATTIQAKLNK
jgi:uncharacterized protein YqeY